MQNHFIKVILHGIITNMAQKYYKREAEALLNKAAEQFPAVLVTGSRQSGKATLLKHRFPDYSWAGLDDLETRRLANRDPEYFFSRFPPPVVIDEIQYAPDLLSYIKVRIDKKRHLTGQFILTGSQTFQVMKGVSETLAGRIAIFDLFPLTWNETLADRLFPTGVEGDQLLLQNLFRGFYPELHVRPSIDYDLWFQSYVQTYIERDVRDIKAITNLYDFQAFMKLLAPRAGQLLNLSEIAKEVGIAFSTAKEWLSILESTYIVKLLRPYHNNHTKRVVKAPKLYFVDTGLLCYLLAVKSVDILSQSPFLGNIFENMCIMEVVKYHEYTLAREEIFFYRDASKNEVDLVIKSAHELRAYEIKFTKTPKERMLNGLIAFKKEFPQAKLHLASLDEKELGFRTAQCIHWTKLLS